MGYLTNRLTTIVLPNIVNPSSIPTSALIKAALESVVPATINRSSGSPSLWAFSEEILDKIVPLGTILGKDFCHSVVVSFGSQIFL